MKEEIEKLFLKQLAHEREMNRLLPREHQASNNQIVRDAEQFVKDMFFEYLDAITNQHTF